MKKHYIYIILILSANLFAKEIDKNEVFKFATNWITVNEHFFHYGKFNDSNEKFELKAIKAIKDEVGKVLLYVAELNPKGFILLANDDRLKPIIGYSSENNFNYKKFSEDVFLNTITTDLNDNLDRMEKENITSSSKGWNISSSKKSYSNSTKSVNAIIGPFLNSDWGQGYVRGNPVYNFYNPNRWPAGCVATSTAQLLNYYKWPYQGFGSHGYYDNGKYLSANFGKTFYDWANTLDQYQDTYFTTDNQKAAGLLTYHSAVALEMDFEQGGSTASTSDVPGVMHNYFRYSGHYSSKSTSGFWDAMKKNMLDERPAIISIKSTQHSVGHAAVVDGYFETNGYYHCNPGWYGDYNGWYNISGSWQMETYNIVVGATKGIVPSPQVNDIEILTENSFIVSWKTSRYQKADFYQLQQARSGSGPWTTLSNSITDTTYVVSNADKGSYYYKVRAKRDNIWWDYSKYRKVQLGTDRAVTFQVDMTYTKLNNGDTLVIRGNKLPLIGNANSLPMERVGTSDIYKLTLNFDYDLVGETIIYRYFIQSKKELVAEQKNREYVLTSDPSQVIPAVYFDDLVSVDDDENIPTKFNLEQNYPNPFNPTTTINYSIPVETRRGVSPQNVLLKVYDILGTEIATLVNKEQSAGNYSVAFNASNLPTGIYFYQIKAGQFFETKKMLLIK